MNFQNIIQGGGLGVAIFALWILFKIVSNHEKHFLQALKDNSEATKAQSATNQSLKDAIENLAALIMNRFK